MKPISTSSEFRRGPVLDERRKHHSDFVAKHLIFRPDLKTRSSEVSRLYGKWLGVRHWYTWDVRNLYIGLVKKHGVTVKGNTLIGVGVKSDRELVSIWSGFYFETLRASSMLFHILSGLEGTRPQGSVPGPGRSRFIEFPGLPHLCTSVAITELDRDHLYGKSGIASRIAFKGWLFEIIEIWEHKYRKEIEETHSGSTSKLYALGDLTKIRNDIVHHSSKAKKGSADKCGVLEWFKPDEEIILEVRHVLDFLNQIGALNGSIFDYEGRTHSIRTFYDKVSLLRWNPKPKLISVRTLFRDSDPYLCAVFSNGLFGTFPVGFSSFGDGAIPRRKELENARIDSDGNLLLGDGTTIMHRVVYESIVNNIFTSPENNSGLLENMPGPWVSMVEN